MRSSIFLFLAFLFVSQLNAQAPGYLGKRLYVKADAAFMISFGPTTNNRGFETHYGEVGGGFAFDSQYGVQLGYAISRKQAVTLGFNYIKTGMRESFQSESFNTFSNDYDLHKLFYHLTGKEVDFGYYVFKTKRGGLAPVGSYSGFHLKANFLEGEIIDKQTIFTSPEFDPFHKEMGHDPSYTYWSFGWEIGQNFILKDRLILSFAWQFNIPLSLSRLNKANETNHAGSPRQYPTMAEYNQEIFDQGTFNRLSLQTLVNAKVAVGFLIK